MSRKINEIGNIYGQLTVIDEAPSKNKKACWVCQCSCGNTKIVTGDALRQGNTTSCGCMKKIRGYNVGKSNKKDLTGKKFGLLTVIESVGSASYGGVLWKCQCECGNYHIVESGNLQSGKVKSCGCLISWGEAQTERLLRKYNIIFSKQYTPQNWIFSTGTKPYFDFAIFDSNNKLISLLEYNGEQHRHAGTNGWNNKENFEKNLKRDKEKQLMCEKNNIPLNIIWYDEDIEPKLISILENLQLLEK